MTNTKGMDTTKQTLIDWLIEELGEYFPWGIGGIEYLIKQAKEMEKEQMCKFAYKCHNHYKVYGDFNIEQYYEQTYGGNK